jgi:hypothetical protein
MEIMRFDVTAAPTVTLYMKDLPVDADQNNTIIYIRGAAVGPVTSVELVAQIIRFSAANAVASGKITVRVTLPNGTQETATSAEDYEKPKPDEGGKDRPKVNFVTPPQASPDGQVTLKGINLDKVSMVSLMLNSDGKSYSYSIRQVTAPDDKTARFKLPSDVHSGTYPIVVTDKTDGARIKTNRSVNVAGQ